jgi:hypothetical protein
VKGGEMKIDHLEIKKHLEELKNPFQLSEIIEKFAFTKRTAFRFLKKFNILSSVNHRAQYYISPLNLKFNCYGLCTINGICFSRFGNLLQTVTALVNQSKKGITAEKIGGLVGTNVQLQLRDLSRDKKVYREKNGYEYIYFSIDSEKRAGQQKRTKRRSETVAAELNSESHASLVSIIKILTTYIHNPGFSSKSIALSLYRRGENISTEKVRETLEKFDVAKKNF